MEIRKIYKSMLEYGESSAKKKLTPPKVTEILRRFVGDDDVIIKTHRDSKVDFNQVIVSGAYDHFEDQANFASITLYINYAPEQGTIYIRDIDWKRLCIDVIECLGHELIHQEQYRARDYDIGERLFVSTNKDPQRKMDQEYLGNPDEIEAYGYSIAAEVFLNYHPKIITAAHISKTTMFKAYVNAFGTRHPVVRQLLDFVVKYYSQLNGEYHVEEPKR